MYPKMDKWKIKTMMMMMTAARTHTHPKITHR